ncbi:hypothetical protein FSP39_008042 [Pinctada imbricata]|uniref:Hexosyltransferase n=1 Tax=Pinctada imbricata TaxID=66713 RepID=A0AA88YBG1_PINIB|nr:hypothetical protein FSP39_008042 [Pinctada imbricata]
MSLEEGFRYPLDVNMTELAERRMRNEIIKHRIINHHPFHYIYNPKSLCSPGSTFIGLPLLILIKSSVRRYRLREVIRNTWGQKVKSRAIFKMAFLLGFLPSYQYIIDNEHYVHEDIIQENFIDAYWNNTHKTIMAFNWASQYCSHARTVLFLDDDMFVNLDNLENYVSEIDENRSEDLFSGILAERGIPVNDVMSKWFVSIHDYPYDYYPDYLAGSAIFVSMSVVKRFQAVFPYVRYFGIDDVYLGIVANKLDIVPTETANLDNTNLRNFQNLSILIANHGFDDPDLYVRTYTNLISDVP